MAHNFRQASPALRSHALVIVLLVISLACVTMYAREGEGGLMHTMQSGTSAMFTPMRAASGAVSTVEYSAFTAINDSTADPSTLSELKEQNEQLRQTVAQLEEYRQESIRLQQLLDFRDLYSLEGVTATVLSRSTDSWNNVITIGKGSEEGVRAGLPVAGPNGLVGQVVSVTPHTAEVRLLQDPQSGVAVMIQSNREEGIVKGSLDGLLYLENVSDDAEVKPGDVVITSGLGGSFYRGIVVGTVVKVEGESGLTSRRIVVEPNEKTGPLQEVMVITAMNSEGAAAQKPAKDSDGEQSDSSDSMSDGASADETYEDAITYEDTTVYDDTLYYDDSANYYDNSAVYYDDSAYYDANAYYGDVYTG
ncbi:MAG: rod shape-determining protein MreC [Eggerthellaceae bacterium]|nr:rod shape-determining protein MreC [Eggerthellaceae bacterium]